MMNIINGGVTAAKGYKATGAAIGVKKNGKKDLALIYSEVPANVAGAYTTNVVKAAPVVWDEKITSSKNKVRGIVANSGNANACTGALGDEHAKLTAQAYAEAIGADTNQILVASTGVIGVPLPIDKITEGIKATAPKLGNTIEDGVLAAQSIMTTDLVRKEIAVEIELDGKKVTIGGMAKGSGMIHPNMATLLAFVTTDAAISQPLLEKAIKEIVVDSYNMISVDRDTSTNDTAVVLANGLAGNTEITEENADYALFKEALNYVNTELAKSMARDGEGATKFITMNVIGAKSKNDARTLAKSVITSNLTKAAMFGEDANFGRVLAAMGYAGVDFDITGVKLTFSSKAGEIVLMEAGMPIVFDEAVAAKILAEKDIIVTAHMKDGEYAATAWGCDLTYDYVKINGDYRS
jgi:glutamate N-acetyltransferase/amino-acid N-acetyltransferase